MKSYFENQTPSRALDTGKIQYKMIELSPNKEDPNHLIINVTHLDEMEIEKLNTTHTFVRMLGLIPIFEKKI